MARLEPHCPKVEHWVALVALDVGPEATSFVLSYEALIVQRKPDAWISRKEAPVFLQSKVAKWWLPEDGVFTYNIPLTATGKLYKLRLRQMFKDHYMAES